MEFLPICHIVAYIFGSGTASPVYSCVLPHVAPVLHTMPHPQPIPVSTMLSHFMH